MTPPRIRPRWLGAIVGAVLACVVTVLAIGGLTATGLAESAAFALVFGESGMFSPSNGLLAMWVVPPLAAATAGVALAPSASRRAAWAGSLMGMLTYLFGIVLGAAIVLAVLVVTEAGVVGRDGTSIVASILGAAPGTIGLALVGAVVLAPLLPLAIVTGIAWAWVIRRGAGSVGDTDAGGTLLPGIAIAIVTIALLVLWLAFATLMQIMLDAQPGRS